MAASLIKQDLNQYKLGQTVMISNFGPYIVELEKNFDKYGKGQPIIRPTMDSIYRTYQLSLDDYYKAS
jgi:predicted methyltransferase